MGDQTILADLGPIGEPAFDHIPAEQPLPEAKREDADEPGPEPARQPAAKPEIGERDGNGETDQPA